MKSRHYIRKGNKEIGSVRNKDKWPLFRAS